MKQFLRKITILYIFLGLSCVLFSLTLFLSSNQAKKLIISKSESIFETTLDYSSLKLSWTPLPRLTIYDLQVKNKSLEFTAPFLSVDPDPITIFTDQLPVKVLKITEPTLVIHRAPVQINAQKPELNDQFTYPKAL